MNRKRPLNAGILAVGSELLTPFRIDTNSLWLTEQLNNLGIEVKLKLIVGDDLNWLLRAFNEALAGADIVLVTGGLGPTEDDLTREAISQALGRRLGRDEAILAKLRRRFMRYGLEMTANNERQADVIDGAVVLENSFGSAPGQFIQQGEKVIALLPGPPGEMEPMFTKQVLPRLAERSRGVRMARRMLKVAGLTESRLDSRIAPIYTPYANPATTIISAVTGLEVHLSASASTADDAQRLVDELADKIQQELGENLFSRDGESMEQVVGKLLLARDLTLAVAESCTGGLMAKRLTDVPGSSGYLLAGVVAYANQAKVDFLGVPAELIRQHGAVSPEVAESMARGIKQRAGADIGLAVTGIAGPEGGTAEKPVGLVYVGLTLGQRREHRKLQLPGDRERVRALTALLALDWLRRMMAKHPPEVWRES